MCWTPQIAACAVLCVIEPQSTVSVAIASSLRPRRHPQSDRTDGLAGFPPRREHRLVRKRPDPRDREYVRACRHRAGRGQCLGDAAESPWAQGPRRTVAARDPLRRGRLAGASEGFLGLAPPGSQAAQEWYPTIFCPADRRQNREDLFVQPALAETLRAIARHGARAFDEGPIAADMVATLRERGGLHTEEDFALGLANADFVEPITIRWNGYDVYQIPPNGQGILVLQILGMLEGLGDAPDGPMGTIRMHRHTEAARLAYRDRDAFVADMSQVDVPVAKMLDRDYLNALGRLIKDDKAMVNLPAAGEALMPPHKDTIYLCVVDKDGNACSFINSLFEGFGSAILSDRSGVMMQNCGFGFRVERGHPNCIAPRKRPMHTIIPGMVGKDGQAVMPYGVMGGHYQPMGHSWFLTNMLQYGMDIQEAIDLPRLLPLKGKLQVERGIPADVVARLKAMGHDPELTERPHGGGQAIWIDRERGCLVAGSEPRKDGLALGTEVAPRHTGRQSSRGLPCPHGRVCPCFDRA